jgi:hypothetical protein
MKKDDFGTFFRGKNVPYTVKSTMRVSVYGRVCKFESFKALAPNMIEIF